VLVSFDGFETRATPATLGSGGTRTALEDSNSVSALCKHGFHRWVKSGGPRQGVPHVRCFQMQAQLSLIRRF
jgi:hypothetical protein